MTPYQEVESDMFVYPGQLSVIAICIVMKYPDLGAARKNIYEDEPHRWCTAAAADTDIPGAGGTVAASLEFLHYISIGKTKEAFAYEDRVWANDGKHFDKDGKGKSIIPEARKKLLVLLKEKWGWTVEAPTE